MPMDFREYLLQVDNEVVEDTIWRDQTQYIDPKRSSGLRRPSSDIMIPMKEDSGLQLLSQSAPRSSSLFGLDSESCLELYGQSPPTPALRSISSNPWDIFTAVTSPTKLIKPSFPETPKAGDNGVFFDLYEDEPTPPESHTDEKTPHLSRLKSLSCPPHWPCKKDQEGNALHAPKRNVVSFADDFGLPLTSVCIFTESPNDPPRGNAFRRRGTGWSLDSDEGITIEMPQRMEEEMQPTFEQPIGDFVGFMKKLDSNQVCLENAYMREQRDLVGTVKVKNMAPDKNVSARVTFNDWQTYCDVPAWFSGNVCQGTTVKAPYDTFSFKTKIPLSAQSLAFAIRYRVEGQEFWDSNGGDNYKMKRLF